MHTCLIQNVAFAFMDLMYIPMGILAIIFPTKSAGMVIDWAKFFGKTWIFCNCYTDFLMNNDGRSGGGGGGGGRAQIIPQSENEETEADIENEEDLTELDRFVMEDSRDQYNKTDQSEEHKEDQIILDKAMKSVLNMKSVSFIDKYHERYTVEPDYVQRELLFTL